MKNARASIDLLNLAVIDLTLTEPILFLSMIPDLKQDWDTAYVGKYNLKQSNITAV